MTFDGVSMEFDNKPQCVSKLVQKILQLVDSAEGNLFVLPQMQF